MKDAWINELAGQLKPLMTGSYPVWLDGFYRGLMGDANTADNNPYVNCGMEKPYFVEYSNGLKAGRSCVKASTGGLS